MRNLENPDPELICYACIANVFWKIENYLYVILGFIETPIPYRTVGLLGDITHASVPQSPIGYFLCIVANKPFAREIEKVDRVNCDNLFVYFRRPVFINP
jgi:hypothetical protein